MLGLETPVERLQHMNQPAYEFYLNRNPGIDLAADRLEICLLYTSPSPRD